MASNPILQGLQNAATKTPAVATPPTQTGTPEPSQADGVPADYQGPENGPFECDDCSFFVDPGACSHPKVVQELGDSGDGTAPVDAHGCCNKFKKGQGGQ